MTIVGSDTTAALAAGAIPFTDDPSTSVSGLDGVDETLSSVSVIGLGECTHGTREFVRARHRLLRHLVRHGLRAVAFEAPFSEALPLGEYVLHGRGDALTALAEISYWIHDVEEVLATVEWLRQFNINRPLEDRVRLYGVDVGSQLGTDAAATSLRETLGGTLPTVKQEFETTLDWLAGGFVRTDDDEMFRERLAETWRVTTAISERLRERRATFESAASPHRLAVTLRQVRTIQQVANVLEAGRDSDREGLRDQYMAENVSWVRDHEDVDTVAVWAHAGHVFDTVRPSAGWSMGRTLRSRYGEGYYALVFEIGSGGVTAVAPSGDRLSCFEVGGPPEGSLAHLLRSVPHEQFLVDFRELSADIGLNNNWYFRQIGSKFNPEWNWEQYHTAVVPRQAADGVVYIDQGSPVQPINHE